MKKISVIIPVYNHEKYLKRFLQSLDNQTYKNIEYIAVNDGSTDNSLNILLEYEKKHSNFKVINQDNLGVTGAKRTGLNYADGDYISIIESDDWINSNYFESLVSQLERTNTNICNPRYAVQIDIPFIKNLKFYSAKKEEKPFDLTQEKASLIEVNVTQCKLYRREYYNLTDKYFRINEDLCMTYYNCAMAERISFSNDAVYHYIQNKYGLVSTELSGYGVRKIKNFIYPLEELENNFKKSNIYAKYQEEVEAIFIKNYMEHICDLIIRMVPSKEQHNMITILISILNQSYPNWQQNKYYQEKFKNIELTDYFRTTAFNLYNKLHNIEIIHENKETLIDKYHEEEISYQKRKKY